MTREELEDFKKTKEFVQIKLKEINYEGLGEQDAQEFGKDFDEVMTLAEKALSAEPCNDAISRQAVLDSLHNKFSDGDSDRWWNSMSVLYVINKVPPVQPIRPMGEWIYKEGHFPVMWKCSECGMMWGLHTDYCPACGAKMETEE